MKIFSKNCPACNQHFTSLVEFMSHIKKAHKDIPPGSMAEMGKEHKWKLRG